MYAFLCEARSVHFWHSHYITLSRTKDGGGFIGNGRKEQFVGIRIPSTVKNDFLVRSEEHTSELQSLMRISYPAFCLKHTPFSHFYFDPLLFPIYLFSIPYC